MVEFLRIENYQNAVNNDFFKKNIYFRRQKHLFLKHASPS